MNNCGCAFSADLNFGWCGAGDKAICSNVFCSIINMYNNSQNEFDLVIAFDFKVHFELDFIIFCKIGADFAKKG